MRRAKKKGKCSQPGCDRDVHSCRLCRLHYGRKWRGVPMESREVQKVTNLQIAVDRKSSIERELQEAQYIYERVTGLENRIEWRSKIRELECALSKFDKQLATAGC